MGPGCEDHVCQGAGSPGGRLKGRRRREHQKLGLSFQLSRRGGGPTQPRSWAMAVGAAKARGLRLMKETWLRGTGGAWRRGSGCQRRLWPVVRPTSCGSAQNLAMRKAVASCRHPPPPMAQPAEQGAPSSVARVESRNIARALGFHWKQVSRPRRWEDEAMLQAWRIQFGSAVRS